MQMQCAKTGILILIAALAFSWHTADALAQDGSGNANEAYRVRQVARQNTTAANKLPNVDRLTQDGAIFTDWYSRQSCTSGHAAFTTGQYPIRTGLSKIEK